MANAEGDGPLMCVREVSVEQVGNDSSLAGFEYLFRNLAARLDALT